MAVDWGKISEAKIKDLTYTVDSKEAFKKAVEKGLKVVIPDEYTLQIDIDKKEQFDLFEERLKFFKDWFDFEFDIKESISGYPHMHIYVKLNTEISDEERVFLQLFLGSDPTREFLSFQRIRREDDNPTLFLERV